MVLLKKNSMYGFGPLNNMPTCKISLLQLKSFANCIQFGVSVMKKINHQMALFEKTRCMILRHQKICPNAKFHCSSSKTWPMVSNLAFQSQNKLTTRWRFLKKLDVQFCAIKKYAHVQNFIVLAQKLGRWCPIWRFSHLTNSPPDGTF